MKKQFGIFVVLFVLFSSGCATLFRQHGYKDELVIKNATEQTQVFTELGVEIPLILGTQIENEETIVYMTEFNGNKVPIGKGVKEKPINYRYILLPTKKDYVLTFKDSTKVQKVEVMATIDAGWFILDVLFPPALFIDFITGNIYGYPELRLK